jgi:hypothetical protein
MSKFLIALLLITISLQAVATNYYSQQSGDPAVLGNWNSLPSGGGAVPASFTNPSDQFFIQSGHIFITTSNWVLGATNATTQLAIQSGGVLQSDYPVLFTGQFYILDGGTYIHNNKESTSGMAGASIFGGAEFFSSNSTVEIRNWIDNVVALPVTISWGNLILNYTDVTIGNWNQGGDLTTIQGNFIIRNTGAGQEFRLTTNTNTTLTIGGNLIIEGGTLRLKNGSTAGRSCVVIVNGSIQVNSGTLHVGQADAVPNCELRFRTNLTVAAGAIVMAADDNAFLIADGAGATQFINCAATINCNYRIEQVAVTALQNNFVTAAGKNFVVAGSCQAGNYSINSGGPLTVTGVLSSNGLITMNANNCTVCRGNASYISGSWCNTLGVGSVGQLQLNAASLFFDQSVNSQLYAGITNSKGEIYVTNNTVISFNGTGVSSGAVSINGTGVLSFDENSYVAGNAFYNGSGGTLRTASADGLTPTGAITTGNIRVSQAKNYDLIGVNNFEYFGTLQQQTGLGLPPFIDGELKINNANSAGVTLTQATTVSGAFNLTNGRLKTDIVNLLVLSDNVTMTGGGVQSFVDGPLQKNGDDNFLFHVGKQSDYAPITMSGAGAITDVFTAEYFIGNPKLVYGSVFFLPIIRVSGLEYWTLQQTAGSSNKNITLSVRTYSNATDLSHLLVVRWDGVEWRNEGNTAYTGISTGTITSLPVSGYGTFTLASDIINANPLPAINLNFTVAVNNNKVILGFILNNCCDAKEVVIEKSTDKRTFTPITAVFINDETKLYTYTDNEFIQDAYYRLRIKTTTGNIIYSLVEKAVAKNTNSNLQLIQQQDYLQLKLNAVASVEGRIKIMDATGGFLQLRQWHFQKGLNVLMIPLRNLPTGIYVLQLYTGKELQQLKFLKR